MLSGFIFMSNIPVIGVGFKADIFCCWTFFTLNKSYGISVCSFIFNSTSKSLPSYMSARFLEICENGPGV